MALGAASMMHFLRHGVGWDGGNKHTQVQKYTEAEWTHISNASPKELNTARCWR